MSSLATMTKGAVGYFRVSTKEQAANNNSLPVQEGKFNTFCKSNALRALCTFLDKESGRTANKRPGFQKMLEYCRKNSKRISCVIVADLSRFARNVVDQGQSIVNLKQLGIDVVSIDEPITDDTAAGKLARNMLGAMNQFYSDSLSEKTKYRMVAGMKAGRWLWMAPLGYQNKNRQVTVDSTRASLIRKAYELVASGRFVTIDAVLRQVTALGLRTRQDKPLPRQSFQRLLSNPFYCGWVVSGQIRCKGNHVPLVSEDLFEAVQRRLNGKSTPHIRVNDDFPLRGFVRCAKCNKPLTAGWAKGRKERYARYWCWQKGCRAVGVSCEGLEKGFLGLLGMLEPTVEIIAQLPDIARREWANRKSQIGKDAEHLTKQLEEQRTLNQRAIKAKLEGKLSEEDFQTIKKSISEETFRIEGEITSLDLEKSTMETLIEQSNQQVLNFAEAWNTAGIRQKQELQLALFPNGLAWSHKNHYFEPANTFLMQGIHEWLQSLDTSQNALNTFLEKISNAGGPSRI